MISIEQLIAPINEAQPCGVDLSFSSELDAIAEARRFDDPSLDQGEWVTEIKEADWGFVVEHCADLLQNKSKDLRLAVWFAEACAKENGFHGLAEGYHLLAELTDRYWQDIHPVPDDNDQELRIGNVGWLLGRSVQLVREMPITEGRGSAFSTSDLEFARSRNADSDRSNGESNVHSRITLADIESARRKSSPKFYETLLSNASACKQALLQLERSIDAKVGQDGPAFSATKDAIDDVISVISRFASESGVSTKASSAIQQTENVNVNVNTESFNAAIENRAQALKQLRNVADFFRRTEPHSPVAYLADKAANWGDLPLDQWLRTVIKDQSSLSHIEELLGLRQAGEN